MTGAAARDPGLVDDRRLVGDEQLEEVVPAVERVGSSESMWAPLVNVNHLQLGAGEVLGEIGAVPAGLLVLPLAGHEHRHLDLVDERDRVERVGDRGL